MSIYSTPDPVSFDTAEHLSCWSDLSGPRGQELREALDLSRSTCGRVFTGYSLQASRDRLDDN